jgi:hypothetical protein
LRRHSAGRVLAAVDVQDLAADVIVLVAAEERD